MDFRTGWTRRKKEKKEARTMGTGEWALSEVVHKWSLLCSFATGLRCYDSTLCLPRCLCITHHLAEQSLTNSTDEQCILEWVNWMGLVTWKQNSYLLPGYVAHTCILKHLGSRRWGLLGLSSSRPAWKQRHGPQTNHQQQQQQNLKMPAGSGIAFHFSCDIL